MHQPQTESEAPRAPVASRVLVDVVLAAAVGGAAYWFFLGHRSDYIGHLVAGFGGTLVLLAFPLAVFARLRWSVVFITIVAIGIGAVMEATVYRLAIFDPVDFFNQSLGACLAGAAVIGHRRSFPAAMVAVGLGLILVWLGFRFAFG